VSHRRRGHSGQPGLTLAEIVAQTKADPATVREHGTFWGDPERVGYELVTDELSPEDASALVRRGVNVVYDPCGCGGYCGLDWLSADELTGLAKAAPPVLRPNRHGIAALELWQSRAGKQLIVTAVDVYWGDVLPQSMKRQ
jgi:hypothetical protein